MFLGHLLPSWFSERPEEQLNNSAIKISGHVADFMKSANQSLLPASPPLSKIKIEEEENNNKEQGKKCKKEKQKKVSIIGIHSLSLTIHLSVMLIHSLAF